MSITIPIRVISVQEFQIGSALDIIEGYPTLTVSSKKITTSIAQQYSEVTIE